MRPSTFVWSMKTPLIIICSLILLAGCVRREPSPIRVKVVSTDHLEVGGTVHTLKSMQKLLRQHVLKYGNSTVTVFEVPQQASCAILLPVFDLFTRSGLIRYRLDVCDAVFGREFFLYYCGDGPRKTEIEVDLDTDKIRVDRQSETRLLEELLVGKDDTYCLTRLRITETTPVAKLIEAIDICNRHPRVITIVMTEEWP